MKQYLSPVFNLMKRFGVSLEDDLLKELDVLVERHQLPNRSQAIRFLIRRDTVQKRWEGNQTVSGCVVLVYNHHRRNLLNQLMTIQHDYEHFILSSQHVHLDHDNCLETILLKGKAKKVKELADQLIALKGIKHGELVSSVIQ